ncbi:uncharacterized protein LOC117611624 isoform X2 [Osmia lignaria lignaria]
MWVGIGLVALVSLMKHEYPLGCHRYLLYGDGSLCMNRQDKKDPSVACLRDGCMLDAPLSNSSSGLGLLQTFLLYIEVFKLEGWRKAAGCNSEEAEGQKVI